MGIRIKHPVSTLSEKEFHRLDDQVMEQSFNLYNSIGNLWDENDYKTKLLKLFKATGIEAHSEVQATISHKDFSKSYFIDLLLNGSVYELKTVAGICSPHESQTLNYLFLTNTQHGKVINFRPDSLEWRFVSTSLTLNQRRRYYLNTDNWISCTAYPHLPDLISELLDDWGAYLEIQLYKEAILFFMGLPTGTCPQRFTPLTPDSTLHVTGLSRKKPAYLKNLQKYINASAYQKIEWINFDQNKIEICTLGKK